MVYKKKLIILGSSAVFLALVYVLSLVLDPERINARNERFTWLPADFRTGADRIEIIRGGGRFELVLKNGAWVALVDSTVDSTGDSAAAPTEVPAKQGRIDDLFRILSSRGAFPRRGSNAASHSELGLDGSTRLIIRGGAGLPLLDLLVGKEDPSGRAVFLRKNGENEFRSGDRLIGTYVHGEKSSWFDLKLFEELSAAQVQRIQVRFSGYTGTGEEDPPVEFTDYTIARSGENWIMDGTTLDKEKTEAWIRNVLEAQGEDALPLTDEAFFAEIAGIRIELGDGSSLELRIGTAGEDGKSAALVSGKSYRIVLPQWTVLRLLRDRLYFRYAP